MTYLDILLERNKELAAHHSAAGQLTPSLASAMTKLRATIIGCVDMRVDPAQILGFELGEAAVIRNIGGRVQAGLLQQMSLLGRLGEIVRGDAPPMASEAHLIVLHHTDCGITRLDREPAKLAQYFQIEESELSKKEVSDPRKAVAVDVAILRAIPALASKWTISGLVYDVATGLVEVVVPPAPVR